MNGTISKILGVSSFHQKSTFSDSDLDLLEATLRRTVSKSLTNKTEDCDEVPLSSTASSTSTASKIILSVKTPEGGTLVSSRNSDGRIQVRIEYTREQLLDCAKSPLAILPPASIKEMVLGMPEILAPFPIRHGYTEDAEKKNQM